MGRLRLVAWVLVWCASPAAASAAEITRLSTAGEKDNPFDLQISVRWDRLAEAGDITRERARNGVLANAPQLRYTRTSNVLVPRIAFGVYEDVEVHVEVPYVLADDHKYEFDKVNGVPVDVAFPDNVSANTLDAMNQPCPGAPAPCPLFAVPGTVYHGGKVGDVKVGLAWAILNDAKDDTTASWVIGVDVTGPSASLYDPAEGRGANNWVSPHAVPAEPGPLGEKIWKYDFHTALSRRFGPVDPYLRAHVTAQRLSNSTYSNCEHADVLSTNVVPQMTVAGAENCVDPSWKEDARAELPWLAGMVVGVEAVPFENPAKGQKVTLDLRGWVDYTSRARFFNELTDLTGKLMFTEAHHTAGAQLGLYLRASRYVKIDAIAAYSRVSDHLLSGESLGRAGVLDGDDQSDTGVSANAQLNPNYDYRWDPPGRRFRLTKAALFTASFAFTLSF
jgi:hypothetical protein